jgi:hypothetical protein
MTHPVYYTAEPSATQRGFVGIVICSQTHRTLQRTALVYAAKDWAVMAAQRLWGGRAATMARAAGLIGEVA